MTDTDEAIPKVTVEISPCNDGETLSVIEAMLLPFGVVGELDMKPELGVVHAIMDSDVAETFVKNGFTADYTFKIISGSTENKSDVVKAEKHVPSDVPLLKKESYISTSTSKLEMTSRQRSKEMPLNEPFKILTDPNVVFPLLLAYYTILLFYTIVF